MARRKSVPKLPKGGGHFERTGKLANKSVVGRGAAKASAKRAAGRKAGFNAKHPRQADGKFRNK
jgi:hypothetical protein